MSRFVPCPHSFCGSAYDSVLALAWCLMELSCFLFHDCDTVFFRWNARKQLYFTDTNISVCWSVRYMSCIIDYWLYTWSTYSRWLHFLPSSIIFIWTLTYFLSRWEVTLTSILILQPLRNWWKNERACLTNAVNMGDGRRITKGWMGVLSISSRHSICDEFWWTL
mgnify:CR=1 FL=1